MVKVRESRSMVAAATARAMAVAAAARAREVARGGGDVRERARWWWERAPHGENENGLERKKIELDGQWKMGFYLLRAWEVGAEWKERKKKKIREKSFGGKHIVMFYGTCLCNTD